jgi:hypothetical protein
MKIFAQKKAQQQQSSTNLTRSNMVLPARNHAHEIPHLQRTIGNQAALRSPGAEAEGLDAISRAEASANFAHDFSRIPLHAPAPITLQPKLTVNTPGDVYEQEADHVAEQVMRMSEPNPQGACACGGGCSSCQTEQPSQEHQRLQFKHVGPSDAGQIAAPPIVHEVLASPGQTLDTATRAFFEPRFGHDFSHVRVHTNVAAEQSALDVNASAYTVGHDVVFGARQFAPGTREGQRLLAHELTHVMQQRGSVEVSASSGTAQRKAAPKVDPAVEQWVVDAAMRVLDDVLDNETSRIIDDSPQRYRGAIEKLYQALVGHHLGNKDKIFGRERRELFDEAFLALDPLLTHANESQRAKLMRRREAMLRAEADDRVDNSLVIDKKIVEIPDDRHPREQAAVLRASLPKLVQTLQIANEQAMRLGEEELEHALKTLGQGGRASILKRLAILNNLLGLADAWLTLTDEEFQRELPHIQANLHGVSNFAEMFKAFTEIGFGAVSLTAILSAAMMKAAGEPAMAAAAMDAASLAGQTLGNVVAGIEIVHGIVVLLDPKATNAQKERAAFGVASGGAWFVGKHIGGKALGATVGAAASVAVVLTYLELKAAAYLYWQGALGLNTGLMREMWEYMQQVGGTMARAADSLARAGLLFHEEQDPIKAKPLANIVAETTVMLATVIDDFLLHCLPSGKDMGWGGSSTTSAPGNIKILAEAFAPLQSLRGAKSGSALAAAATMVIEMIAWCLTHAGEIVVASTKGRSLHDVKEDAAKAAQDHEE